MITENMYNFIYITVLIMGGATSMLSFVFYKKVRSKELKAVTIFVCGMFVYMFSDFTACYYLHERISDDIVFMLIIVSDVLFVAMVLSWIYMIVVLAGVAERIKISRLVVVTVVYEAIMQTLSITKGVYSDGSLSVADSYSSTLMCVMEMMYGGLIVFVCCIGMMAVVRKNPRQAHRWVTIALICVLLLYMIWVFLWDVGTWYGDGGTLLGRYALDPLISLYIVLNIVVIYYFFRYDPLNMRTEAVAAEKAVMAIAEEWGLSARETEITMLLNQGCSNIEIADKLGISESTVKKHVSSVLRKSSCSSRNELISMISNR